jgi:type VI secretion system protein ImpG
MDPRLLRYYNRELQFIREMGGEFAREFPKIAGRLGMDGFEVADPYVERLLEGFAFLAARVQLKLDDEFPRFTQHLLDMVYPHYLCPTPSMAVVQLRPNLREGALADGVKIPRETVLRGLLGKDEQTACEYRTAHETTLWPLEMVRADYRSNPGDLTELRLEGPSRVRAALRLRLRATAGLKISNIAADKLTLFLRGDAEITTRLYEQLTARVAAVVARGVERGGPWTRMQGEPPVGPIGFEDHEALLPFGPRSFQGYRLLHEYFAFPSRFLFVELGGLSQAFRQCDEQEIEIVVLFDTHDAALENAVDATHVCLFCAPAINLFPRRADRIHLTEKQYEYHVVADRTRPMDFEVYQLSEVVGHGADLKRRFQPFYACSEHGSGEDAAWYTVRRTQRKLSERQRSLGPRSSYVGSETWVSLVDSDEGPYRSELKQLALETLCTNRDLPLHLPLGQGTTDFTLQSGAPVESIRCVAGPSPPRPSPAHGDTTWRLISQLSVNYLSLADSPDRRGAASLREILSLYADLAEAPTRREIDSVVSSQCMPVIRHLPVQGAQAFGRGVEVTVTCDESGFPGAGAYLLAQVLERFFARYASINSFTETVLKTIQRGEVKRWPPRAGLTHAL